VAIGKQHTALVADRDDRADQMLVQAHAAGNPVHDHAETLRRHIDCSCRIFVFGGRSGAIADHVGCTLVAKPGEASEAVDSSPPWIASRMPFSLRSQRSPSAARNASASVGSVSAKPST